MSALPPLPAGVYRHWKGPLYLVLGYGHDANAEDLYVEVPDPWGRQGQMLRERLGERAVVVYVGLQLDEAHPGPRLAVRTSDDFFAKVHTGDGRRCPGDGCVDKVSVHQPRFRYVGPSYEPEAT